MATEVGRRGQRNFDIHEDATSTEDTEMDGHTVGDEAHTTDDQYVDEQEDEDEEEVQDIEEEGHTDENEQELDGLDDDHDLSEEEELDDEMRKLQDAFPGFKHKYRLIKRIGEGTFSTVYKAQDLQYDRFDNRWDVDKENEQWTPPPFKRHNERRSSSATIDATHHTGPRRRPKYVAIKKIYVTSSPARILNELELLHDLRDCEAVCPLITAFRSTDQVVAILPYFRHQDFRDYFRVMTVKDMSIYLRSLFTALRYVHEHDIIHRDIKPTNFLYDRISQRGVLVDFGLAEREGTDNKPCACHEDQRLRAKKQRISYNASSVVHGGYPKNDTRPSRRANRAGTRGFRAPEVLFKCTQQTTKLDIWSAGVILLTIMSRRFPFFNSADDVEAMIEIGHIFGTKRMKAAGSLHGCVFETSIPTMGATGYDLGKIIMWSTVRNDTNNPFSREERIAIDFLTRCLELDPQRRICAEDALGHEFLLLGTEGTAGSEEEDMDILEA